MLNLLAISGSPRPDGHTAALLSAFLQGAEAGGAEVTRLDACKLRILGCTGCNACARRGECILQDDMPQVFQQLGQADLIVLASPLYFMGISGQLKLLVDRCQTCWNRRYQLRVPPLLPPKERKGYFLSTGGAPNSKGTNFKPAIATITYFFDALDAKYLGTLTAADTDRSPVIDRPELLATARSLGFQFTKGDSA